MHIWLADQVFGRPVRRIVVDDEESVDSEAAVVVEERRESKTFISAGRESPNLSRRRTEAMISSQIDEYVTGRQLNHPRVDLTGWNSIFGTQTADVDCNPRNTGRQRIVPP